MAINKISDEQLHKILKKSAKSLPNRPTRAGYTAEEIKKHLTDFVLGDEDSIKIELDRIVDEINDELKKSETEIRFAKKLYEEQINLFNFNNLPSIFGDKNSASVDYENRIITITNQYYCQTKKTLRELAPSLEIGETYILSAVTLGAQFIYLSDFSNSVWYFNEPRVITEDDLKSYVVFYGGDTNVDTISNIQIVEGTTAKPYNLYQGGRIVQYEDIENFKNVKTIYDMSSNDSDINKGYTSGLKGGNSLLALNLTNAKKLNVFASCFSNQVNFTIDLEHTVSSYNTTNYPYLSGSASLAGDDLGSLYVCICGVNDSKNEFKVLQTGYFSTSFTARNNDGQYYVTKIEEVY